ncbi:AMP-binding protein [Achromobacter anxifer]
MHTDASGWQTRLDPDMAARYAGDGRWQNITLAESARLCARDYPDQAAVADDSGVLTFQQLWEQALRLAGTLRDRGLRPGSVVSFQLPNWRETLAINLACAIGGFVCNPIVPIYRDAELKFILANSKTRVLFIPDRFRSIDYLEMIRRLRPDLPHLEHLVLVRAEADGLASYASWAGRDAPLEPFAGTDPDAIKLLLYTSGTTGNPKGVLHSHNTLRAEVQAVTDFWGLSRDDVLLMPSPVTHITGYLYALELPFLQGTKAVLMERWEASAALDAIQRHQASFSIGATPFLVELVAEVDRRGIQLPSLRLYGSGGAPVPPEVVKRANAVLPNCKTFRIYGSSEAPTISLGIAEGDPAERGATTDGLIFNHEVRIVDPENGAPLAPGLAGEITARGPEVMLGYTDPSDTEEAFDADGYFHTGDLGYIDENGYITVTGRKKDLIIRGGENISPKEIEDLLHQHPAIQEAAVVAFPHARMGETPCVYLVLRPGRELDFPGLLAYLESARLARQKFPERMFVVDDLPRTATGKVLKHVLKARAATQESLDAPRLLAQA